MLKREGTPFISDEQFEIYCKSRRLNACPVYASLFIFQTVKTANEGARLCFIYFVALSFLLSSLQRGSLSWDSGHSSCETVKLWASVTLAIDLRNPCTSLVVLVMNKVDARSLDKEEESNTQEATLATPNAHAFLSLSSQISLSSPFVTFCWWSLLHQKAPIQGRIAHVPCTSPHQCTRPSKTLPAATRWGGTNWWQTQHTNRLPSPEGLPLPAFAIVIVIHSDRHCRWSIKQPRTSN